MHLFLRTAETSQLPVESARIRRLTYGPVIRHPKLGFAHVRPLVAAFTSPTAQSSAAGARR